MSASKADNKSSGISNPRFNERIPLTLKMVMITVIVGISIWAFLDYVHSSKLKRIFQIQLLEKLSEQSMEDRLYIDRYIRAHQVIAEFFVTQSKFKDHISKQEWTAEEEVRIKYYQGTPLWFPQPSLLRILARPRYTLLLDPAGRVREVYHRRNDSPPAILLKPTQIMLLKSHKQSLITKLEKTPYLLASESYLDNQGKIKATLMFASPIDEEFLIASKGPFIPGRLVALVTLGKKPRIVTSSNREKLPEGTPLSALRDRFLITGQHTYDYGSAEYVIKLVSFISMSEVDSLTKTVITTGRHQRNIIAPLFILTFALLMTLVARRINRLNSRMSDFSQQTLGTKRQKDLKGDQLYILENSFHRLTEEVIEARELLKKQAEEKTRLIVNNAFDAIITLNADCIITTWNHQAEVIFGWTDVQAIGHEATNFIISPADFEAIHNGIKRFLDAGDSSIFNRQIQISALHHTEKEFPAELAISPAQSGGEYFFVVILRDIYERKLAEDQIVASLREKEVLLKEIHHRGKNNMQVISSLLSLQSRYFEDSRYIELFDESRNRINSMALVHEKLYQSNDLSNIDFNEYVRSLANGLFTFYGINPANISLKIDIKDAALGIDTAIPCGLVINELVSNSLKYAFPAENHGKVLISLIRNHSDTEQDSTYELIVKDDGIGMPEDLDISKAESLGLQLVTNLVKHQLQGDVQLNRDGGTEFRIQFKELQYKKRI
jgi:PAS domain S-box-containing protein